VSDELATWQQELERAIARGGLTLFDRVFVVRETSSTQDIAQRFAAGRAGAVVLAGRQHAGRGRLGRIWWDARGEGVALTVAADAGRFSVPRLSIAAGLAAARVVDRVLPRGSEAMAIRWPNDVVEPRGFERKIAGVLIEVRAGLALIGIGINVHQQSWPPELSAAAVSLDQVGSNASRVEVASLLLGELERALLCDSRVLYEEWSQRNVLLGRSASFICGGTRYEGVVESLTTDNEIVLRGDQGQTHRIPAGHASLVHSGGRCPSQDCPAT
jgi:BirA family transcriptional regulator, biotin operon repressor / biotin---[acetyl-CoA-carboxylase] ligase